MGANMKKIIVVSFMLGNLWGQGSLSAAEADAVTAYHAQSLEALLAALQGGKLPRAASSFYNNTDKSKIDILYGTWQLTYKDTAAHTDTLALDSTFNDSSFGYYGWDGKHALGCYYEPGILKTSYNYQCIHFVDANGQTVQRYLFNLNGNTLTGKYFSGTLDAFLTALNNNQLTDLAGTNGKANTATDPVYDDNTKILSIPKVNALGKVYNAILVHEGNGLFRLKSANPL